jgi:hypothetical protein
MIRYYITAPLFRSNALRYEYLGQVWLYNLGPMLEHSTAVQLWKLDQPLRDELLNDIRGRRLTDLYHSIFKKPADWDYYDDHIPATWEKIGKCGGLYHHEPSPSHLSLRVSISDWAYSTERQRALNESREAENV